MPTPGIMLPALGDVIRNYTTGFCESNREGTDAQLRRRNLLQACRQFLHHAVQEPGDLLDSHSRATFAKEAYMAYGPPVLEGYTYVTDSPFREMARRIVQDQHSLTNESVFKDFVQQLVREYKDKSEEDCCAMAMELTSLAAGCDAVRLVCDAIEEPLLEFPSEPKPSLPPHFERVSDYAVGSLRYDRKIAWGPYLTSSDFKPEVAAAFTDATLWKFASLRHAPISNCTAVPHTCSAVLDFFQVLYVPLPYFPRFLRVPGPDRCLVRGEIEPAAATYTAAKHCRF